MTPNDYIRDGYAPLSAELRSKMSDLRDKLATMAERGNPDPEQVKRYVAGIEKLIEQGETETAERTARLTTLVSNPANVETIGQPSTRTVPSTPNEAQRSTALRAIERHKLAGPAADKLERVIRSEPNPVHARYIAAVASDAYASA